VRDKSARVRFETILAAGPGKFIPQLVELAHGRDKEVAGEAAEKLKQIGAAK
jgi:hypothetical protein